MRDQLMHSSLLGWHQGEVSSIINLLVSTSLGSMFLCQQFSSGGGLLPIKTTYECVSGLYLYLSGNWELGDSGM